MALPSLQQVDVVVRVAGLVITVVSVVLIPLYTKALHGIKASVEQIADASASKVRVELDEHARQDAQQFEEVHAQLRQMDLHRERQHAENAKRHDRSEKLLAAQGGKIDAILRLVRANGSGHPIEGEGG